ncbi:MAG: helix-turn-helix transcriptional regulator [Allosphingosinicella sp.]
MTEAPQAKKLGRRTGSRAAVRRAERLGNPDKRGSFDSLIARVEEEQIARGEKPTLSSAAYRAGNVIRMMRKSRRFSQAMLARRLGVSQARISELEAGVGAHGPSWDLMERVAKACGATILISPPDSEIAVDASEPFDSERQWTLASAGG